MTSERVDAAQDADAVADVGESATEEAEAVTSPLATLRPLLLVIVLLVAGFVAVVLLGGDGESLDGTWSRTGSVQGATGEGRFAVEVVIDGGALVDGRAELTWQDDRPCDAHWSAALGAPAVDADVSDGHVGIDAPATVDDPCQTGPTSAALVLDRDGDQLVGSLRLHRAGVTVSTVPIRLSLPD